MDTSNRFFSWIRASLIVRGDDRWVGGVCSGLAQRLGWSPTLVRALMVASVLLFGYGAALYAIGWLFLPDGRTGRILIEDLIAGHWAWDCLGAFLCLAVAVVIPWGGLFAMAMAAFTLWFLVQSSHRQQEGYGYAYRGGPRDRAAGGATPDGGVGNGAPDAPVSAAPIPPYDAAATSPAGSPGDIRADGTMPPAGPSPAAGPMPGPAPYRPASAPYPPATAPYGTPVSASAPYPHPSAPAPAHPRAARRKPAGPIIVLVLMGAALLSGAIVAGMVFGGFVRTDVDGIRMATLWSAALCLVLGATLVALGARGRRTGGLHPLVWTAALIACVMLSVTVMYGAMVRQVDRSAADYVQVQLAKGRGSENQHGMAALQHQVDSSTQEGGEDYWVADASPQTMTVLSRGVFFIGDNYDSTRANIDLTGWGAWRGGGADACPVGRIDLAVRSTRVQVTLPDGCRFAFGSGYDWTSDADRLGDAHSVLLDNGNSSLQFLLDGNDFYGYEHQYGDPHYAWRDNASFGEDGAVEDDVPMDQDHYLFINLVGADHGSVTVRYASDSTWPGYAEMGKRWADRFDATTTREHLDVADGKASR